MNIIKIAEDERKIELEISENKYNFSGVMYELKELSYFEDREDNYDLIDLGYKYDRTISYYLTRAKQTNLEFNIMSDSDSEDDYDEEDEIDDFNIYNELN